MREKLFIFIVKKVFKIPEGVILPTYLKMLFAILFPIRFIKQLCYRKFCDSCRKLYIIEVVDKDKIFE